MCSWHQHRPRVLPRPDPEEFVDEALSYRFDTREVDHHLLEPFQLGSQSFGFGAGHERVRHLEQPNCDLRSVEGAGVGVGELVEDVGHASAGGRVELAPHPSADAPGGIGDGLIVSDRVHDPTQPGALELEDINGFRGEEDALTCVSVGGGRLFALRQLLDRGELVCQTELLANVRERPHSVVRYLESDAILFAPDRHVDERPGGMVDGVVDHLRHRVVKDALRSRREILKTGHGLPGLTPHVFLKKSCQRPPALEG